MGKGNTGGSLYWRLGRLRPLLRSAVYFHRGRDNAYSEAYKPRRILSARLNKP